MGGERRAGQREKYKHTYWWPVGKPLPIPNDTIEHVYFGVHLARLILQQRTSRHTGEVYTPKPEYTRSLVEEIAAVNCLFAEFDAEMRELSDAQIKCLAEQADFRALGTTAHDSYVAWREGAHDDLVPAVAMACWYRERYGEIATGFSYAHAFSSSMRTL
jgi:hypothetical protein